ncbi:hypothetical protein D3C86_1329050 [compost metagenome]
MRQVKIHQHAAFINALVEFPQTAFRSPVIPPRQLLIDLAHRLDVETPVLAKGFPLDRMRFASSTPENLILGPRLTKQLNQRFTGLVLRLVLRDPEDIAQLLQSAWQRMRHSADHRIKRLFNRNRKADRVSHYRTVKGTVLDHLLV